MRSQLIILFIHLGFCGFLQICSAFKHSGVCSSRKAYTVSTSMKMRAHQPSRQNFLDQSLFLPLAIGINFFDFAQADESLIKNGDSIESMISYREFNDLLLQREIKSAKFYGSKLEKCVVELLDGKKASIGAGYPKESPSTDESPTKVLAQLRNAGVPYAVMFDLGKNYSKGKLYRSKETVAAEDRQRVEDDQIEKMLGN